MTLKVALIQKSAAPNDPEKNMELGISYLEKAKELGADLALFPEMWSTGYAEPFFDALNYPDNRHYVYERQKWSELALTPSDSFVQAFCNTAKKLSIGVVLTGLFSGKKAPRNTALLIDRTGNILLRYDKVHTCDFSMEALLENGEDFPVCEFDGIKIGLMICFDREFPESARILMLNGAEIILVPNACDMNPARLSQLSTRAMENMVGVAMANYPSDPSLDRKVGDNPVLSTLSSLMKTEDIRTEPSVCLEKRKRSLWSNLTLISSAVFVKTRFGATLTGR